MPDIGTVLKDEIKRLARRSTRPLYGPLRKDVAHLKHQLAEQKRLVLRLARNNADLMADLRTRLAAPPAISEQEARKARISPRLIRAQRERLGLSREDFAKLLGASAHSVFFWETDRAKPRKKVKAALAAVRRLGKREARLRLEAINSSNGHRKHGAKARPIRRQHKGKKA